MNDSFFGDQRSPLKTGALPTLQEGFEARGRINKSWCLMYTSDIKAINGVRFDLVKFSGASLACMDNVCV